MNVRDIYTTYGTPENLQQHMLRVAGLGSIVLQHWIGRALEAEAIIDTLLFHDIAKPVTFDVAKQARFVTSASELKKLEDTITSLITHFGSDEHLAALKIFQEIGLNAKAQHVIDNLEWHYTDRLIEELDLEALIAIYCDMRIGPDGILKITERIMELHARVPVQNLDERLASARRLEDLISNNMSIDPNRITNEQVDDKANALLNKSIR